MICPEPVRRLTAGVGTRFVALAQVLRPLDGLFNAADYPDLLVGLDDPDDAAVWDLGDGRALVVTTDFITPPVNDPYLFGQIAAANAISDVYAMGGRPICALNVCGFPACSMPLEMMGEILNGGRDRAALAGIAVAAVGGRGERRRPPVGEGRGVVPGQNRHAEAQVGAPLAAS